MSNSKKSLVSVNPFNGETLKNFEELSPAEVTAAIARAHDAFPAWRDLSFSERGAILKKVAQLFRDRDKDLQHLMAVETGKQLVFGAWETNICAEIFDYYADESERILAPKKLSTRDGEGTLIYQPLGVVYGIMPWNGPMYQPARFTAPNLMAGNVVLIKHASNCPQVAEAFEQLLHDAGVPEGVFTNLLVSSGNASMIIDDPRVRGISFTGSNAGGARVAEQAGRNVKKTVMELGGADPFIVLEDADLEKTIDHFVEAKLGNAGQVCIAPKRIILTAAIAQNFIDGVAKKFSELEPGDPLDESTGYGPLCSEDAAKKLEDQIQRSIDAGAKLVSGGKRDGAFIQPTILTDIPPGCPAAEEELFGPVACMFVVPDEAAAVAMANDSEFGLGSSVFTQDHERGQRVAEQLEAGTAFVNNVSWTYASMPMGGVKKSGYGRELGELGIKEFVNEKLIRHFDL